jgi:hypothetical protein
MNPRLYIMKLKNAKDYSSRRAIRFAVVDSDIEKTYPSNFICMLPQHVSVADEDSSVFARTFKDTRVELAKQLLTSALESEDDSDVKAEIKERLKMLAPKPAWQPRNRY